MPGRSNKKIIERYSRVLPVVVLVNMAMVPDASAFRPQFNVSGSAAYNDNNLKADSFSESQNVSVMLGQNPAPLLALEERVRYARSYTKSDGRLATTQNIYPAADLAMNNDFFGFNLGATTNKNLQSKETSTPPTNLTWQSSMASAWRKKYVPSMQLSFSETQSRDDRMPRAVDSLSQSMQAGTKVDLGIAQLDYNFSRSSNQNNIAHTEQMGLGHFASLGGAHSFFDNRVAVSFNQKFNYNKSEYYTRNIIGGAALVPPGIQYEARAATNLDNTLDWADLSIAFPVPVANQRYNIAIKPAQSQVDRIYLYTNVTLNAVEAAAFTWSLYTNASVDGTATWTSVGNMAFTYNTALNRFEIQVPGVSAQYIMLVQNLIPVTLPPGFSFSSNVETEKLVAVTNSNELVAMSGSTNMSSGGGIGYRVTPNLMFSYSTNYETSETDGNSDKDALSNNVSMNWDRTYFKSLQLGIGERKENYENDDTSRSISYSLAVTPYMPLPSVDLSLLASRSTNFFNGAEQGTSTSFGAMTKAQFYKHLSSSLDLSYGTSESPGSSVTDQNFHSALRLTSRVTPSVTATLEGKHDFQKAEEFSQTQVAGSTLSWRVSDMLVTATGVSYSFLPEAPDTALYSFSFNLAMTPKTRFNFSYGYSDNGDSSDSHALNADWYWNISSRFSYRMNGNYSVSAPGKNEAWAIASNFLFNF